jgi:hypothetical protein
MARTYRFIAWQVFSQHYAVAPQVFGFVESTVRKAQKLVDRLAIVGVYRDPD